LADAPRTQRQRQDLPDLRDNLENKARQHRTEIGTGIKIGTGTKTRTTGTEITANKAIPHHVQQESISIRTQMMEERLA